MAEKPLNSAAGFVHTLVTALGLSDEACNMRFLSDRSLYVLQNLANVDVNFYSRYGVILENNRYIPVEPDTTDSGDVDNIGNIIRRDLALTCNGVLEDLVTATNAVAAAINGQNQAACCPEGAGTEILQPESETGPDVGPGEQFENNADYLDWKCDAANLIYNQVLATLTQLDGYSFDAMFGLGVGVASSIIAAAIASGPIGGTALLAVAAVSGIVSFLGSRATFSVSGLLTDWSGDQDEFVCLMYQALTTSEAKSGINDFLASLGATVLEVQFMGLLLNNDVLNQLFVPLDENIGIVPDSPIVCTSTCDNGEPCDLAFQVGLNLLRRGSGDLARSGLSRTLTAVQDENSLWYVSFQVGNQLGNHFSNCDNMPDACTTDELKTYTLEWESTTGGPITDTNGAKCLIAGHSTVGSISIGVPIVLSWVEWISDDPFTVDAIVDDGP